MQRLEVLIAVMLARERRLRAATAADGCTELAAALATLPSGLFEIVADAVAALSVELQSVANGESDWDSDRAPDD